MNEQEAMALVAQQVELELPPEGPPDNTILVDAEGTAWQYGAAARRWWPANNYGSVAEGRFTADDGPFTLVWAGWA